LQHTVAMHAVAAAAFSSMIDGRKGNIQTGIQDAYAQFMVVRQALAKLSLGS